jgi:hypothetical protein
MTKKKILIKRTVPRYIAGRKWLKIQRFGSWICFRPQMRGETRTLLGPLERANLN